MDVIVNQYRVRMYSEVRGDMCPRKLLFDILSLFIEVPHPTLKFNNVKVFFENFLDAPGKAPVCI